MKKYILIFIITILFLIVAFFIAIIFNLTDDFVDEGPANYTFVYEGGDLNSIIRDNKMLIENGVVDFKYNDDYVVFSVDTTYSLEPEKVKKTQLKYYIHDVKKDILYRNINYKEFKKIIQKKKLEEIDLSK